MKSDLLRCDQQSGNLDFDLQPGPVEPFLLGTDITIFNHFLLSTVYQSWCTSVLDLVKHIAGKFIV